MTDRPPTMWSVQAVFSCSQSRWRCACGALFMRRWHNGRAPAFQAGDEGSIPARRSKKIHRGAAHDRIPERSSLRQSRMPGAKQFDSIGHRHQERCNHLMAARQSCSVRKLCQLPDRPRDRAGHGLSSASILRLGHAAVGTQAHHAAWVEVEKTSNRLKSPQIRFRAWR